MQKKHQLKNLRHSGIDLKKGFLGEEMKTISEMREIVALATPGDWQHTHIFAGEEVIASFVGELIDPMGYMHIGVCESQLNARFIATFNPVTVTELLDRIEKLEAANRVMRDALFIDWDCGDSSCRFAVKTGGMRTNGGCRCIRNNGLRVASHLVNQKQALVKAEELMK